MNFKHRLGKPSKYHFPDIMVAGCGVIDFNQDGLMDLILVNSGDLEEVFSGQVRGREENQNRIFRQTDQGTFVDVTSQVKLSGYGYGCGVAVGDVNNDGFDDIYFANFGDDRLLLNLNGESFKDITIESEVQNPSWSSSASFIDFDLDGKLDLFVTNYVSYIAETNCANAGDAEDFCNPRVFKKTVDKLFRNVSDDQGIRFQDVTSEMGIAGKSGPGLGVISRDFNHDGYPDIYVANDGWENFLWINQEGKTFSEQGGQLGCAMSLKGSAQAGMGVAADDLDHNGTLDIVVTHLNGETNAAYLGERSRGEALFFTESGSTQGIQKIS
ncbi:MAG: VCBS repeat-containing protein, partial [Planctomycetota bacterium]|nr:VCBS repeat-containing protein [Planctomycetota bacterium]